MNRFLDMMESILWVAVFAVAMVIAAVISVVLGGVALGVVLAISSITFALLALRS